MMMDWFYISHKARQWWEDESGVAVMEAAILFPPMLTLLMGTFDMGNAIVLSEKTITSSQVAADLVARNRTMDSASITDIISGAKLAFEPYALSGYGIDVVSVRFDASQNPEVLWRETQDMEPNTEAVASLAGFAEEGEGMIVVTVKYTYAPQFAKFFMGDIDFTEVAFTRGRRSATVTWEE
ncbi:MAG: TadE/TadG family type IV pilus assembly protein [Pseudobdellovibrionaceae bacterium]